MTASVLLRALNAVTGMILIGLIIRTVLEQHRRGVSDWPQDWRFIGLAIYCLLPATAVFDRLDAAVTWRTWLVPIATVASAVGVIGIRRQQRRNPPE